MSETTSGTKPKSISGHDLGVCPTNQRSLNHRQCGFAGCVDLRPWAKANRYRYRLEESYNAEDDPHVRGDGRWFVEIPCRYGLIYPFGGETLLAYATGGVKRHIAGLGPDVQHHQTDGNGEIFKFPIEHLAGVAAILKPRKRRSLDPERARAIGKATAYGAQVGQIAQERTQSARDGER